jgi:AcrR family transcriptional regulator
MEIRTSTRGRQAQAAINDERLLAAAREVFATQGYDAPVSAVASSAGIGMGSLYRRYGSKDSLLADVCLRSMRDMITVAESVASLATPLDRLESFVRKCVEMRSGAFAGVAGMIPVSAEMIAAAERSQRLVTALVAAAQTAGQVRADVTAVDLLRLIELFSRSPRDGVDDDHKAVEARLLTLALAGLRAGDVAPLPGPAPTLRQYRQRWART